MAEDEGRREIEEGEGMELCEMMSELMFLAMAVLKQDPFGLLTGQVWQGMNLLLLRRRGRRVSQPYVSTLLVRAVGEMMVRKLPSVSGVRYAITPLGVERMEWENKARMDWLVFYNAGYAGLDLEAPKTRAQEIKEKAEKADQEARRKAFTAERDRMAEGGDDRRVFGLSRAGKETRKEGQVSWYRAGR